MIALPTPVAHPARRSIARLLPWAAMALLFLPATARAQEASAPPILHAGEEGPWLELFQAELALLGETLAPAWAPAPEDAADAAARLEEWGAAALVVAGEPVEVWLRGCGGPPRRHRIDASAPGPAALVAAELVHAHGRRPCAARPPERALGPPSLKTRSGLDEAPTSSSSSPSPPPGATARAPTRPGGPADAPPARLELAVELHALRDRAGLAPRAALGLAARLGLHRHLGVQLRLTGGAGPGRGAFGRTWLGAADLALRAHAGETWRFALAAGPSLLLLRATRPESRANRGAAALQVALPAWALELGLGRRVGAARVGLIALLRHTGRRHPLPLGDGPPRRWGPIWQLGLRVSRPL